MVVFELRKKRQFVTGYDNKLQKGNSLWEEEVRGKRYPSAQPLQEFPHVHEANCPKTIPLTSVNASK